MADYNGRRQAAYLEIADEFKRKIREGELAPGTQLPTEAAICTAHGVSRTVARAALARLREDGYTYSQQGKGHFVADLTAAKPDQHSAEYTQISETLTEVLEDVRRLGQRLDKLEELVRHQPPAR